MRATASPPRTWSDACMQAFAMRFRFAACKHWRGLQRLSRCIGGNARAHRTQATRAPRATTHALPRRRCGCARRDAIARRTSPIARNCANFFRASQRIGASRAQTSRAPERKNPRQSPRVPVVRADREAGVSGLRLPAVRRTRPGRATR
jgi:hypothetical protein